MVDAELLIAGLRRQVYEVQALLSYLEIRDVLQPEDYAYSQLKLRQLLTHLQQLEDFSARRSRPRSTQAHWVN